MPSNYLILSCDGGGIRGLIPAMLVQRLDQQVGLLERVNLFAGTSAGGIISVGLASEVPISTIVNIFMTQGAVIFQPYKPFDAIPAELRKIHPQALNLPADLLHVKYTDAGVKKLITQTYPATKKLSELNRNVLVTTLNLYDAARRAWSPITLSNLPGQTTADTLVLDAALSTSAAPVYFPPHVFEYEGHQMAYADGGIFANNPSMLAAASVVASGTLKEQGLAFPDIKLLSIGTGFTLDGIPRQNLIPRFWYGVVAWLSPITAPPTPQFPLLSALMDSVSDIDSFECGQILGDNFRRANVQLTEPVEIDDYKKVPELKQMVEDYMETSEWLEIVDWAGREFV